MLNAVLKELNDYFLRYTSGVPELQFSVDSTFEATDTINGVFTDTFIAGEYVLINGSRVNDGVYLVKAIDGTSMTIDDTVDFKITAEATEVTCTFTKLFIPPDVIDLVDDIKEYDTNVQTGVKSESQGNRSVAYGSSSRESSTGWIGAFTPRLNVYKKLRWC